VAANVLITGQTAYVRGTKALHRSAHLH